MKRIMLIRLCSMVFFLFLLVQAKAQNERLIETTPKVTFTEDTKAYRAGLEKYRMQEVSNQKLPTVTGSKKKTLPQMVDSNGVVHQPKITAKKKTLNLTEKEVKINTISIEAPLRMKQEKNGAKPKAPKVNPGIKLKRELD